MLFFPTFRPFSALLNFFLVFILSLLWLFLSFPLPFIFPLSPFSPSLFFKSNRTDHDDWKDFLSKASLPFVLRLLTGLSQGHPPTQSLLGSTSPCIPVFHKLEQVSTNAAIGKDSRVFYDAWVLIFARFGRQKMVATRSHTNSTNKQTNKPTHTNHTPTHIKAQHTHRIICTHSNALTLNLSWRTPAYIMIMMQTYTWKFYTLISSPLSSLFYDFHSNFNLFISFGRFSVWKSVGGSARASDRRQNDRGDSGTNDEWEKTASQESQRRTAQTTRHENQSKGTSELTSSIFKMRL